MNNLGKASVKVEILNYLPHIDKEATQFNFEVSAFNWPVLNNSPYFPPLLTDYVSDELDTFAACFPSKRKHYSHNFLVKKDNTPLIPNLTSIQDDPRGFILFRPTSVLSGVPKNIIENTEAPFTKYTLKNPGEYVDAPDDYAGPKWAPAEISGITLPNDKFTIQKWLEWLKHKFTGSVLTEEEEEEEETTTNTTTPLTEKTIYYLNQQVVRDGLWWAVESENFLKTNTPFWVNLRIMRSPPSNKYDTMFVISLGVDDPLNSFDILISQNNRPRIIDYFLGRQLFDEYTTFLQEQQNPDDNNKSDQTVSQLPIVEKQFDSDFSRYLDSQEEMEIGIMTIAGRLVVFVNQVPVVYTRIDRSKGENAGTFKEAKIAPGKIRIYGTNVQAAINVCPMTFASMSVMALPIASYYKENNKDVPIVYHGIKYNGELEGPVCKLPTQPDAKQQLFGVDCKTFIDPDGGDALPSGVGFHQQGEIFFLKSNNSIASLPKSNFYVLIMRPEKTTLSAYLGDITIERGGCPYFFKLKGGSKREIEEPEITSIDVTDVLNISESVSAPDYFHSLATATVEIYNKGGIYDYLASGQYAINIYWGWDWGNEVVLKKTFLGVIVGANISEVPGKETITLQCEDYMTILKNTPIINSPFYDGMVAYYAIQDIAKRAGIKNFVKDWDNEDDYFLPSGYAFTKPLVRFDSRQMLFNCAIDIVKRFEAFIYFDSEGQLHIKKLPGGLFSDNTNGTFVATFYRNPDEDVENVILNEKNVEYNFASVVNRINIFTLDRDTRNPILYTKSAVGDEDHILYRKILLLDQPAYGDLPVAKTYASRLADRVFYPMRKVSIATAGSTNNTILDILDFIKVDNMEFRLTSINRKYDAASNNFNCEYGAEWLGGISSTISTTSTTTPGP